MTAEPYEYIDQLTGVRVIVQPSITTGGTGVETSPAAQTVPIPQDLRWLYEASPVLGNVNFSVETGRSLIERIARAEATIAELELKYRKIMWLSHGHLGIYGDDGEMQCSECTIHGCWDYKNVALAEVEETYKHALAARATGKES